MNDVTLHQVLEAAAEMGAAERWTTYVTFCGGSARYSDSASHIDGKRTGTAVLLCRLLYRVQCGQHAAVESTNT